MANNSFKVIRNGTTNIEPDGHVSIVDQLALDDLWLDIFAGDGDDTPALRRKRVRMLRRFGRYNGGTPTNAIVTQLDENGAEEPIRGNNCRILCERDEPKPGGGRSKVTVSLPAEALDVSDLAYVDEYIEQFVSIYGGQSYTLPRNPTPANRDKARKFMFGVFMLTKCR